MQSTAVPSEGSADITPEQWRTALRRLGQAGRLNFWNADYAAERGRHYAWLAWRNEGGPRAAAFREAAEAGYLDAVLRRPTYGYAWANFAEQNLLAGNPLSLTLAAMDRAVTLAPYEPDTQKKTLLVGFSRWDELSPDRQETLRETLRRALNTGNQWKEIIRLAVQSGRAGELDGLLTKPEQKQMLDRLLSE